MDKKHNYIRKYIINIDNFNLVINPIKYEKNIYWVTTPHGIYINSERTYEIIDCTNSLEKIKVKFYKQSYRYDLLILKSVEEINFKITKLKILKAVAYLKNIELVSIVNNIEGTLEDFSFITHLDTDGGNRNYYYKINKCNRAIVPGDSGTALYSKNKMIGLITHKNKDDNKSCYLLPSFLIIKLFKEDRQCFSPYLRMRLIMKNNNIELYEKFDNIKKGYIIKFFDGIKVSDGTIFCKEIKGYLPIDTYLQIYGSNEISISDGDTIITLQIENLNKYLHFPFVSGISLKKRNIIKYTYKTTFQDLWLENKRNKLFIQSKLSKNIKNILSK